MKTWIRYQNVSSDKELTSLPAYAQIAAEVVDTLEGQGLCDIQILRILDLARRDMIIKSEFRIQKAISE